MTEQDDIMDRREERIEVKGEIDPAIGMILWEMHGIDAVKAG